MQTINLEKRSLLTEFLSIFGYKIYMRPKQWQHVKRSGGICKEWHNL